MVLIHPREVPEGASYLLAFPEGADTKSTMYFGELRAHAQ